MLWVRWKRKRVTWHQLCITWKEPDKRSPADRWGLLHQSREFPQFTQNFHRISEIKKRNPYKSRSCAFCLVPTMRLELIRPRVTTPSRWRVYQFHHVGIICFILAILDSLQRAEGSLERLVQVRFAELLADQNSSHFFAG